MKGQKCQGWQKHANRFRAREMGPLKALQSLGFKKSGQLSKQNDDSKLAKFIQTWSSIEEAIGADAPTTVSEWHSKMKAAKTAALKNPTAPRLNGNYLLSWHLRALLRDRMVAAGVSKLSVDSDATVYKLMRICPDQSKFLFKIHQYLIQCEEVRGISVKQFIAKVAEADTPPELLSMWSTSCTELLLFIMYPCVHHEGCGKSGGGNFQSNSSEQRYCFAKDKGWKDWYFDIPMETWSAARAKLLAEDGVEPHITASFSLTIICTTILI